MSVPSGKVNLSFFFGSLIWMFSFSSCGPKLETLIYVPVNKYISFAEYTTIGVLETHIYKDIGVHRVVLLHKDIDVWEAYDLTCMYKPRTEGCEIDMTKSNWLPQCPCCKSVFSLLNEGFPDKGPAQQGLHPYHVYMNNGFLQITN